MVEFFFSFPDISFINEKAIGYINEEPIGAINKSVFLFFHFMFYYFSRTIN